LSPSAWPARRQSARSWAYGQHLVIRLHHGQSRDGAIEAPPAQLTPTGTQSAVTQLSDGLERQ
jgi:hypothetical protein